MSKPIKLFSHASGPNPWKVVIILEELKIPYESVFTDFADLKKEPFEAKNPNGRVPVIEDPNNNITLWESGAIVEYLLDFYDKSNSLSYTDLPKKYLQKSWLAFQISGQGPYFGQAAWFKFFHSEKNLTSVLDRYDNEIKRVLGVIDRHLKKEGTPYLLGDKATASDLVFLPWCWGLPMIMGKDFEAWAQKELPTYYAWYEKLQARPAVKKAMEEKQKAGAASKH